jgi:hypothetical protein
MRGIPALLLAGLLMAVTAPHVAALCAVDEEGGCSRLRHTVVLDIEDDCDAADLCLVAGNDSLDGAPNDADWSFVLHNHGTSAITLELFAIGSYDPDTGEPVLDRAAARKLASIEVAAGESLTTDFVHVVPGNVSHVRIQALSEAGTQAEIEAELSNVRIMMMQPGDGPVDDSSGAGEEPAGNLDDDVPVEESEEDSKKESPGLPLALLVVGCLAAVLLARRLK